MLLLFRFFLLVFIFFGLFQGISNHLKIRSEFLPFITVSGISLLLFFAGLLNVMLEITWVMAVFSFYNLFVYWKNKQARLDGQSPGMIFFLLAAFFFAVTLRGSGFVAYDDFSHWGLVAREMLLLDRLPNFSDSLISFQAYPTGTASFIYFVSKILGSSEAIMLWAQSLILLAGITPLFVFVKKGNKVLYSMLILYVVYLLFGNNGINSLYVDTILTSISVGTFASVYYYLKEDNASYALLHLFMGNSLLIVTKNSGLLFAIINIVFFLLLRKRGMVPVKEVSLLASPLLFKLLWDKHVAFSFPAGESTKHSMSMSYFQTILDGKTFEDILLITGNFIKRSLNFTFADVAIFLFILVFLYVRIKHRKGEAQREKRLFRLTLGIYVAYQIGLWLTYVLSMPLNEAVVLASYTRYNLTLSVFLLGVFLIYYFITYQPIKQEVLSIGLVLTILFFSVLNPISSLLRKEDSGMLVRNNLVEVSAHSEISTENPVYIYIADLKESYATHFLTYQFKYQLRNSNVHLVESNTLGKLYNLKGTDSTVIILMDDEKIYDKINEIGLNKEQNVNIISRRVE